MRHDIECVICGFCTPAVEARVPVKSQGQWYNIPGEIYFADDEAVDAFNQEIMDDHFAEAHPGVDQNWTDEEYAEYLASLEN